MRTLHVVGSDTEAGKVVLETADGLEKFELPIKRPGTIWLVKGVGAVKLEDAYDKSWELVETSLPLPKK